MMQAQAIKNSRVGLRVPTHIKRAWEDAAALEGRSLSDIIIAATSDAVASIIDSHRFIHVSYADMERIMENLRHPPEPSEVLLDAAASYKKAIEDGELVIRR